jgi:hypothetical protein
VPFDSKGFLQFRHCKKCSFLQWQQRNPPAGCAPTGTALSLFARASSPPATACTEAIMIANGFTIEQMVELVRAGEVGLGK